MADKLLVNDLQELMEYKPEQGGLYWRERSARTYMSYIDDIDMTEALKLSRMFNTRFAGKECGITCNGNKEFVRVTLGTRGPNIRRAKLELIWAIATGEWSKAHVLLINPEESPTPDNLVCCSSWVAQIFANPSVGLHRMGGATERYYWRILMDNKKVIHQESGYTSLQDARDARDAKLKELGLWQAETLDEKLNG